MKEKGHKNEKMILCDPLKIKENLANNKQIINRVFAAISCKIS